MKTFKINGPIKQKAILRENYPKINLEAGTVVYAYIPKERSDNELVRFITDNDPLTIRWIKTNQLLPLEYFLKYKPEKNFYALANSNLMRLGKPYFINNTKTLVFDYIPFHFESLGEVNYFLKLKNLDKEEFLTVHFL